MNAAGSTVASRKFALSKKPPRHPKSKGEFPPLRLAFTRPNATDASYGPRRATNTTTFSALATRFSRPVYAS